MRILVIDDHSNSLNSLCLVLKDLGHDPVGMEDPLAALAMARKEYFPLIITDIRMPGLNGLELLTELKNEPFTQSGDVVLITGHGDMSTAVEALRKGAYDYLSKPINARELSVVVDRAAEHQSLMLENQELRSNIDKQVSRATADIQKDLEITRHRLREVEGIGPVIVESPSMLQLLREALILHGNPSVPVLIEGETGTGKEVLARYVHHGESVVEMPFMAINCAAIPHELFESELFGHEQGAFTGSRADGAPGKLEQAGKGSLFLDEVAEMPLSLQPKLLRVLEERSFYRVGGMKKRSFAARIICAGNRNMQEMVERGSFRRDLYHRLRVGHLLIPPLRERFADIRPLAEYFFQREVKHKKKHFTSISSATMEILQNYSWPGNVRELENTIERAVLMHDGQILLPEHVNFLFQNSLPSPAMHPERSDMAAAGTERHSGAKQSFMGDMPAQPENILDLRDPQAIHLPDSPISLDDLMVTVIKAAIKRFNGNKTQTAKYLGISRFALHRRLQQMGEE
jgi:DNA-binding NtrC family response regulator